MNVKKNTKNILICCTGSVATIKLPVLIEALQDSYLSKKSNFEIKVVMTENSCHFCDISQLPHGVEVYRDKDEWSAWKGRGDAVLHIELRRWAEILIIAPLDANTLSKIATGICDNLLTCIVRAWDLQKPLLFCPAMNTYMWNHPITIQQITVLKSWGYVEIPCISKKLMCGDLGVGAMADVSTIVDKVTEILNVSEIH